MNLTSSWHECLGQETGLISWHHCPKNQWNHQGERIYGSMLFPAWNPIALCRPGPLQLGAVPTILHRLKRGYVASVLPIAGQQHIAHPRYSRNRPAQANMKRQLGHKLELNPPLPPKHQTIVAHEGAVEHWRKLAVPLGTCSLVLLNTGKATPVLRQWRSLATQS